MNKKHLIDLTEMERAYPQREVYLGQFGPAILVTVADQGKEEARALLQRLTAIQPVKRYTRDNWDMLVNEGLRLIALELLNEAKLPEADVNYIMGTEIKKDKRFEQFPGRGQPTVTILIPLERRSRGRRGRSLALCIDASSRH